MLHINIDVNGGAGSASRLHSDLDCIDCALHRTLRRTTVRTAHTSIHPRTSSMLCVLIHPTHATISPSPIQHTAGTTLSSSPHSIDEFAVPHQHIPHSISHAQPCQCCTTDDAGGMAITSCTWDTRSSDSETETGQLHAYEREHKQIIQQRYLTGRDGGENLLSIRYMISIHCVLTCMFVLFVRCDGCVESCIDNHFPFHPGVGTSQWCSYRYPYYTHPIHPTIIAATAVPSTCTTIGQYYSSGW